jgi:predicted CXXCH cytochrome family protein
MNCTVCGKPHTTEAPLTIAHENEWLCPGCLTELDDHTGKRGRVVSVDDAYHSPVQFAHRLVTNGIIKIGNRELPVESLSCDE